MIRNYITVAIRNLVRDRTYALINVVGMAVGMTCCALILLFVEDELSFDAYHAKKDRIYRVGVNWQKKGRTGFGHENALTSAPIGPALQESFPVIESFVRLRPIDRRVLFARDDVRLYEEDVFYADGTLFDVFSFPLVSGDSETALEEPFSMVLTRSQAGRYFPDQDPIGKRIRIDHTTDYTVTGVMEDIPANTHFQFDVLLSMSSVRDIREGTANWGFNPYFTYLLLSKGVSAGALGSQIAGFLDARTGREEYSFRNLLGLQPVTDIHLNPKGNDFDGQGSAEHVAALSAIALFILLLACINFTNLSTARSGRRMREVGLRKVVGADRKSIAVQFLIESFLFSTIAAALCIGLIELTLPGFGAFLGRGFGLFEEGHRFHLLGAGLVIFTTGILSGAYPAVLMSRYLPIQLARSRIREGGKSRFRLREVLVVFQFAVSIALIVCTFVVTNQVTYMRTKSLGLNQKRVVVIPLRDKTLLNRYASLKASWLQHPEIERMALVNRPPGTGTIGTSVSRAGGQYKIGDLKVLSVDHDYVETLEIEMLAGRDFSTDFETDPKEAVVLNETAAEHLGWTTPEDAIGQSFPWRGDLVTVIGVTRNFHFQPLNVFMQPLALRVQPGRLQYLLVRIRTDDIPATLSRLEQLWSAFTPDWPFAYTFLDEDFHKLYSREERFGQLFSGFAALAIFIAVLGLFGLAAYTVAGRMKEVGIRKVLGARGHQITGLLSKEFVLLAVLANVFAWPAAHYFTQSWLADYSFRVHPDIGTYAGSGLVALAVALIPVSLQALRASRADPVETLRHE